jgi:phosphatidylserine/phosphatidylglycerophosphate/cardiolipin synthase-like enzyme
MTRSRAIQGILCVFCYLVSASVLLCPDLAHARRKKKSISEAIANRIDAALIKAPVDEEVCFPPVETCDVKLVKFIDSAQKSLDIAIYDINRDEIVHHILVQSKKIPVRMVVDRRQAKGDHSLVPTLIKGGIQVKYGHQRGIMHNKFTIVDGRMIETGSFNYTNNATENSNENQVYLAKPAIVERYKQRFEAIWREGDPVSGP